MDERARASAIAAGYIEVGYFRGIAAAGQKIAALSDGLETKLGSSSLEGITSNMIGPIHCLRLSEKTQKILERRGVYVILQLLDMTESALLAFTNFDQKELEEVVLELAARGLALKASESPTSPSQPEIYKLDLIELELSSRPYTRLTRVGLPGRSTVSSIGQLVTEWSEDDVMAISGFGQKSLDEVVAKLAERGLSLRGR